MKTLITNVTLVDSDGTRKGKVLVGDDGKIKKVYKENGQVRAEHDVEIDGQGKILMPGFIDMHCHLRDPGLTHKEDMNTGLHAAVKGGFTTVVAMANTKPVMADADNLKANLEKAEALGLSTLIQVCAVTKDFSDTELVDFESTRPYTCVYSNDGHNIDCAETMKRALEASRDYDFILATHCEPETETVIRDIQLLRETPGAHLHVCHISKKDTLDAIVAAKKEGLDITCEVTPHHVYASAMQYKVHPPFRTYTDRRALIEGCKNGDLDMCGTDHAPHTDADKAAGSPGINNFETAFAMYYTVFSGAGMPLERISQMLSETPAKRLGLKAGLIKERYAGDFVLVDPDCEQRVDPKTFVSKSHNTPFGREWLKGRILMTIKGGEVVYDYGQTV